MDRARQELHLDTIPRVPQMGNRNSYLRLNSCFLRPNLEKKGSTAKSGMKRHLHVPQNHSKLSLNHSFLWSKGCHILKTMRNQRLLQGWYNIVFAVVALTSHRFTSHVWLIIRISVSSNIQSSRIFAVYLVCYIFVFEPKTLIFGNFSD